MDLQGESCTCLPHELLNLDCLLPVRPLSFLRNKADRLVRSRDGCARLLQPVLNSPKIDFGKLVGVYVVLFFLVAQILARVQFHQSPSKPIYLGGAFIVVGGLIMMLLEGLAEFLISNGRSPGWKCSRFTSNPEVGSQLLLTRPVHSFKSSLVE
jgi:hypothetical protein